jgi:hypothetical protein
MLGDQFGRQGKVKISGSHRDRILAGRRWKNRVTFFGCDLCQNGVVNNF